MIDNVETDWCCGCYELKFTTGPIAGKTMVVQAQNTGYDQPTSNVFNFAVCRCSIPFQFQLCHNFLEAIKQKCLSRCGLGEVAISLSPANTSNEDFITANYMFGP